MSKRLAAWRFVLVALLFAAWIGWLGYLAATKSKLAVLSRPQFLVSKIDVVAEVDDPEEPVTVKDVLFSGGDKSISAGDRIRVRNLKECRRPFRKEEKSKDEAGDWKGPGLYLLPLRKVKDGFEVVVTPPSPGFPKEKEIATPRIYPANDETLRQYIRIKP